MSLLIKPELNTLVYGISTYQIDISNGDDSNREIKQNSFILYFNEIKSKRVRIVFYISEFIICRYKRNMGEVTAVLKPLNKRCIDKLKLSNKKRVEILGKDFDNQVFLTKDLALEKLPEYIKLTEEYLNYTGKKRLEYRILI